MRRLILSLALAALVAVPLVAATLMASDAPAKPMACCGKAAGVQRSVANIDNGVKITVTAADAKAVTMIQEMAASCAKDAAACKDCPMATEGVTRAVEKTDKGVVITVTSADATMVKKVQAHAATCAGGGMAGCCGGKAGAKGAGMACPHAKNADVKQS